MLTLGWKRRLDQRAILAAPRACLENRDHLKPRSA